MDDLIASDLFRHAGKTDFRTFWSYYLRIPGFKFLVILRKLMKCRKYTPAWILYSFLYRKYSHRYHFQMYTSTRIGKGFYIGHWGPVLIHPHAVIGDNCTISHNITIGQTNRGKSKGVPAIGNRVFIGAGAVIVGKIIIGDDVLIAPNSFVNVDVPSKSVVIGNPCTIIPKEDAVDGYVNNPV